jgi:hypothetical protein
MLLDFLTGALALEILLKGAVLQRSVDYDDGWAGTCFVESNFSAVFV